MPDTVGKSAGSDSSSGQLVRPLSPEDRSILALESETVAGHACKVIVLGDQVDPCLLQASVASRLDRALLLRMRLQVLDGEPWWSLEPNLDMQAHVVTCKIPSPPDMDALAEIAARIFEQRLDRSRPPWQMHVVPVLAGGGSALIWRIHHALADGETSMRLAQAVLWDEQRGGDGGAPESRASGVPERSNPVTHDRLDAVLAAVREAPQPWLRSPFDGHIAARRSVAFATVEFGGLHRAIHAIDNATVNDAVLTVLAGALRRWLEYRHGHLGAVRVKVPVSLHQFSPAPSDASVEPGNRDSFFCLDLPLGSADPVDRLRAVRDATRVRKQGHDAQQLDALMTQLGRSPRLRQFARWNLAHPRSFALTISNVRGPRRPVHVLGASVLELYPLAEIAEHHALRVAVASLADTLNFGLSADPTLVPDLGQLARLIQTEAAELIARLNST